MDAGRHRVIIFENILLNRDFRLEIIVSRRGCRSRETAIETVEMTTES